MAKKGTVVTTTVQVHRTVKIGQGTSADEHGESELTKVIEVHRFPDGVEPACVEAGLRMRKSMKTKSENWVAGEISIGVRRPCYREELDDGSAFNAAYDLVKEEMQVHLPKILAALDSLADDV